MVTLQCSKVADWDGDDQDVKPWPEMVKAQLEAKLTLESLPMEEGDTYALLYREDGVEEHARLFVLVEDENDVLVFNAAGHPVNVLNGRSPDLGRLHIAGENGFTALTNARTYRMPSDESGAWEVDLDTALTNTQDTPEPVPALPFGYRLKMRGVDDQRWYGGMAEPHKLSTGGILVAFDDCDSRTYTAAEMHASIADGDVVLLPPLADDADGLLSGLVNDQPAPPVMGFTFAKTGMQKKAKLAGFLVGKHRLGAFGEDLFMAHIALPQEPTPAAEPRSQQLRSRKQTAHPSTPTPQLKTMRYQDIVNYTGTDSRLDKALPISASVFGVTYKATGAEGQGRKSLVVYDEFAAAGEEFAVQSWSSWERPPDAAAGAQEAHPVEVEFRCELMGDDAALKMLHAWNTGAEHRTAWTSLSWAQSTARTGPPRLKKLTKTQKSDKTKQVCMHRPVCVVPTLPPPPPHPPPPPPLPPTTTTR